MRVFAVAQGVGQLGLKLEGAGKTGVLALVVLGLAGVFSPLALDLAHEPLGYRSVIARGVSEGVGGKFATLNQTCASSGDCRDDLAVLRRVNHDGNVGVILGGCSHHRRPTDVDLLDHCVALRARGHGLHKRVEVHNDKFERLDAEFVQLVFVIDEAKVGE